MKICHVIHLEETVSTNTFLATYTPASPTEITIVTTDYQSAGRGQATNRWESERGKNLLFSILVTPGNLPATHLFALSEAIALSIHEAIAEVRTSSVQAPTYADEKWRGTVKWPNDIYVGDSKISGILIENSLRGQYVNRSIIGCGVNINQTDFLFPSLIPIPSALQSAQRGAPHLDNPQPLASPQLPTPVSLRQLVGHDVDRQQVLDSIVDRFLHRYRTIHDGQPDTLAALHAEYLVALYRRQGFHAYTDAQGYCATRLANSAATLSKKWPIAMRLSEWH